MKYPIPYIDNINIEFQSEVLRNYNEASNYLLSFKWCHRIIATDLYLNLGKVLCIFLFKIENTASQDDNKLWVVVGDLPAMYLDTFGTKSTKQVLEDYVHLADDWIHHVRLGKGLQDCYPFESAPTIKMADLLEKKITFIRSKVLENIDDIYLTDRRL